MHTFFSHRRFPGNPLREHRLLQQQPGEQPLPENTLADGQKKIAEGIKIVAENLGKNAQAGYKTAVDRTNADLQRVSTFLSQTLQQAPGVMQAGAKQVEDFARNTGGQVVDAARPYVQQTVGTVENVAKSAVKLAGPYVEQGVKAVRELPQAVTDTAKQTYETAIKSNAVQGIITTIETIQRNASDTVRNSPRMQALGQSLSQLQKIAADVGRGLAPNQQEMAAINGALKQISDVGGQIPDALQKGVQQLGTLVTEGVGVVRNPETYRKIGQQSIDVYNAGVRLADQGVDIAQKLKRDITADVQSGIKNAKQTYETVAKSDQVKFGVQVAQTLREDAARGIRTGAGRVARGWRAVRGFFGL